jgi:hypothetical protein
MSRAAPLLAWRERQGLKQIVQDKKMLWARHCRRFWSQTVDDHESDPDHVIADLNPTPGNPIIEDVLRNASVSNPSGRRYSAESREFGWDLLRTCGPSALDAIRREIPLPSRQSLSRHPETSLPLPDLANWEAIPERILAWRRANQIAGKAPIKCVLAIDALCYKPEVVVSSRGCHGINLDAITIEDDFLHEIFESPSAFRTFVAENWANVYQALFVYHLKPLDPLKTSAVLYVVPRPDGKARKDDVDVIYELRGMLSREHVTLRGFVVDGDPQYDAIHSEHDRSN